MNELPREKLCEVITKYGQSLCDEPLRLEGLLRDFCGKYRLEINLFVNALKEGIATDLRNSSTVTHPELLIARLAKRLQDHHAINEQSARWVVESWALALGKLSKADLTTAAKAVPAKPAPRPAAAPPARTQPSRRQVEPAVPSYSFQQPAHAPPAAVEYEQPTPRRAWPYVLVTLLIVLGGAGAAWYFKLIQLPVPAKQEVAVTQTPIAQTPEPQTTVPAPSPATPAVRPLPTDAQFAFDKGTTAAATNEWLLAAKYFDEARKLVPSAPEVLFRLADAESKIPDREMRALVWFKAYLAAEPNRAKSSEARDQVNKLEIRIEATVQRLVNEARQRASRVTDTSSLSNIGPDQARAGDMTGAADTVNRITDDTYSVYRSSAWSSIAQIQAEAGDISGAESTAYRISSSQPSYLGSAKIAIAQAQAKAGNMEAAKSTLISARQTGLNIFNSAANDKWSKLSAAQNCGYLLGNIGSAQANLGDIEGARQTLNAIPQNPYADSPRQSIRAAIDQAITKQATGKVQTAADLQNARRIALSLTDPGAKTTALYNIITKEIAQNNFDDAEKLVEQIDDKQFYKCVAYADLINALSRAKRTAQARRAVASARSRAARLYSGSLNYVISAALGVEDFDAAKAMIDTLKPSERPSEISSYLQSYGTAKAKAGDISAAKTALDDMKSDSGKSYVVQAMVAAQIAKGDIAGALRSAGLLPSSSERSSRIQTIADYLIKRRQFVEAEEMAKNIGDAKYRDDEYQKIARALAEFGEFKEAPRVADLITNLSQRAQTYTTIASYHQAAGFDGKPDLKHADELVSSVTDPSDKAACYLSIASSSYSVGELAVPQQALLNLRRAAMAIKDPDKKCSALNVSYMADQWLSPGEVDKFNHFNLEAISALKASQRPSNYYYLGVQSAREGDLAGAKAIAAAAGESYREMINNSIGEAQAQKGNIRAAEQMAKTMKDDAHRDDILFYVIQTELKRDDLAGGERTLDEMKNKSSYSYKDSSAIYLATAYLKKKDISAARRCVDKIDAPTRLLDASLITEMINAGQTDWAKQLIAKAEPKVNDTSGWSNLGVAKAKIGDLAGAKQTLTSIPSDYESSKRSVCEALGEAGDIDEARRIASQFQDKDQENYVLLAIAKAQAKKGDKQNAQKTLGEFLKRRPNIYQVTSAANVQYTMSAASEARETLKLIHPEDASFAGWADYDAVSVTEDAAEAKKLADAIKDPVWKSQAYRSVIYKEKRADAKKDIAAQIPDPFYKSQAYQALATERIERADLDGALQLANLVPVADLKLIALEQVLGAAIVNDELGTAEKIVSQLTDSESKTVMSMWLARAAIEKGNQAVATRAITLAQKSANSMSAGFWKARAFDQIASVAAEAKNSAISQNAEKTALNIAGSLNGDDLQLWQNYLFARLPAPDKAAQEAESEKRIDEYANLVDYDLKDQMYTDFASYMRSVEAKTPESQVISGVLQAARAISEELKKIDQVGKPKPTTT